MLTLGMGAAGSHANTSSTRLKGEQMRWCCTWKRYLCVDGAGQQDWSQVNATTPQLCMSTRSCSMAHPTALEYCRSTVSGVVSNTLRQCNPHLSTISARSNTLSARTACTHRRTHDNI